MISIVDTWRSRVQSLQRSLALPESADSRVLAAAAKMLQERTAVKIALFHPRDEVLALAQQAGVDLASVADRVIWVRETYPEVGQWAADLWKAQQEKRGKSVNASDLEIFAKNTIAQAGALAERGIVAGVVAGCVATTADVIRASLRTVGTMPGVKVVSGSFLMHRPLALGPLPAHDFVFADCGVMIDPSAQELVDIAFASVTTFKALVPTETPCVAFLSFSTKGSAEHPMQQKMATAAALFKERYPDIPADGEMQFDAAYVPSIGQRKAPGSAVPGRANIFIFPNLDAGNLAYKIAQRLGGFQAFGPILQGTAVPFSDLSRGATSDDIVMCGYITLIRSALTAAKEKRS